VLHGGPGVSITLHTQPGQQKDLLGLRLAEPVVIVATDSKHRWLIIDHC